LVSNAFIFVVQLQISSCGNASCTNYASYHFLPLVLCARALAKSTE
jgi:hypothetical protein